MANPNFINANGDLSDDGRKLVEWLDAHLPVMEVARAAELNTFAGPVQDFFNRHRLERMTAEQYVRDFRRTLALNAWRVMEVVEAQTAQAEQVQETVSKTSAIEAALEMLKQELGAARTEIAALKETRTPAKTKVSKKAASQETEDELETEVEAEDEAD